MTIWMHLHDGNKLRTYKFERVTHRAYGQLVQNFMSFAGEMKWGVLELKKENGNIILHKFGGI